MSTKAFQKQIVFKCLARLSNSFRYKDPIPKELIHGLLYKFQCGLWNDFYNGEYIRHLDVRSGEHIGVSPLTDKKVKPSNNSAVCDHLLHCDFWRSFDNFNILAYENISSKHSSKTIHWKLKKAC